MASNQSQNEPRQTIFDADFHLTEELDQIVPYLQEPYNELFERDGGEGYRRTHPNPGFFTPSRMGKQRGLSITTKEDVVAAKEELGLEYVLVQPSLNLYLGCTYHEEVSTALAAAYNNWIADEILDVDEGIYGSILVSPQLPSNAATEIKNRSKRSEFVSVLIPSGGVHPTLGNKMYNPIYETSERLGLPITLHNAAGTMMHAFPLLFQDYTRTLTTHATLHPMQHMAHLSDMIVQGIPVRYPDIQIVIQESGLGWIPFMMRRLDSEYLNYRSDAPMLEQMPSDYIRDNFYFTTQPLEGYKQPEYIKNVMESMGIGNIMFSTDYPHFDFDHTNELLDRLGHLDEGDKEQIAGLTAIELFDIK